MMNSPSDEPTEPADTGPPTTALDVEATADGPTAARAGGDDLERINRALSEALDAVAVADLLPDTAAAPAPPELLADLVARLHHVQQTQAWLAHRLDQLQAAVESASRAHSRELDLLRRDLLVEGRATATAAVLGAVVPALDQLRAVRACLDPEADDARQLAWATDVLALPLRALGFEEFSPAPGEPFDPLRMHCDGLADGPPGAVVRTTRPGYRVAQTVALPSRVLVGRPANAEAPPKETSPDE